MQNPAPEGADKKIVAGLFGILLGAFGIHKFVLGYTAEGVIMLVASLVGMIFGSCLCIPLIAPFAMGVIGLVEGILYLSKSDEEFVNTYIIGKKTWL